MIYKLLWVFLASFPSLTHGVLFAQNVADPISGGAGWVGAGLLGLVLGWLLLWHLPQKDKQLKEIIDGKDKQFQTLISSCDMQVMEMVKNFSAESNILREEFRSTLKLLIDQHDKQTKLVVDGLGAEFCKVVENVRQGGSP